MANPQKWVTMGDVARAAGVGTITVSRALRTPQKVSAATLEKVQAAVADLGYVLDETAGALSSQRSRVVGAVVSTLDEPVFASTIRGLTEGLRKGGVQLVLGATRYEPESEAGLISAMLGRRPDALVLTSSEHTGAARKLMSKSRIPVVELWELPETPIHTAVGFSNRDAGREITQHLIDTGRRRIAFIYVDRPIDTRGRLRKEGYFEAISGHQPPRIAALPVKDGETGASSGAAGLREVMQRWPDTDAVVCASDALALGVWFEAGRMGLAVPERLAITGFGDVDYAGDAGLGLTTIRIDGEAIGRRAAELILTAAEGGELSPDRIDMGFTLVRRATS